MYLLLIICTFFIIISDCLFLSNTIISEKILNDNLIDSFHFKHLKWKLLDANDIKMEAS